MRTLLTAVDQCQHTSSTEPDDKCFHFCGLLFADCVVPCACKKQLEPTPQQRAWSIPIKLYLQSSGADNVYGPFANVGPKLMDLHHPSLPFRSLLPYPSAQGQQAVSAQGQQAVSVTLV